MSAPPKRSRIPRPTAKLSPRQETGSFSKSQAWSPSELKSAIRELREIQYLARYGDYVTIVVDRERVYTKTTQTEGWEEISTESRWQEISTKLREEENELMKAVMGPYEFSRNGSYPTRRAIRTACTAMGYDMDTVQYAIHTYAARNFAFHRDIDDAVAQGDFNLVAHMLYGDLAELRRVFSASNSETDIQRLSSIIEILIPEWFDITPNPKKPSVWRAKDALIDAYHRAQKTPPGQSQVTAEAIAKGQRQESGKASANASARAPRDHGEKLEPRVSRN